MRGGRRVSAAITFAAAFGVCCVSVSAGTARAGDDGAHFLLFSGADLWGDGHFLHGGLLWSPEGIDQEGFTMRAVISGGTYRYRSGALNNNWVTSTEEEVQVLPGWRFKRDRLELKIFAGVDIKNDVTSPYDPSSRLHGTSAGVRVAVNLWFEPTPSTMIAADASLTSIATGYSARAAYGWKLRDWFYLGPEAQTFACEGYSQMRLGAHVTGLKTGQFEWSAAAGWANDTDRRSSAYVRFGVLMRR
ncbi:MAG: cellulose biosynthesis protein BcsS [Pseudolabrys sp.]